MQDCKLILVRHGQDEDNRDGLFNGLRDTPLTDLGRKQALETAEKLQNEKIDVIYSSPLLRAKETAEVVARKLNVPFDTLPELIERGFGVLTGRRVQDVRRYTSDFLDKDGDIIILEALGAENFLSMLERAKRLVSRLKGKHKDKVVLLVTHGDLGMMIRAACCGWGWRKGLEAPYIKNGEIVKLSDSKNTS